MRRHLFLIMAALGLVCALTSACGHEGTPSSPTTTSSPSTTAKPEDKGGGIHVFQSNDVGPSGEAASFDTCTSKKEPTGKVPFQFDQTSDMQIYASTSSTLADEDARFWQVVIPHVDAPGPTISWVYGIPMPPGFDGQPFWVYVVSLDGRTATGHKLQPGQGELTLTHEMCETEILPNALQPLASEMNWVQRIALAIVVISLIITFVALGRRPSRRYRRKRGH